MIISSFDKVLINQEEAIPVPTMLEIEQIRKKGILFSVCTNHLYQEVLDYNRDFPFIDYIISLNGSYIYDVKAQRCSYKKKVSLSVQKKIQELFPKEKIIYYTEESSYETLPDNTDIYKIEVELTDETEIGDKLKKLKVSSSILEYQGKKYLEITSNSCNMFGAVDHIGLKNNINLKEIISVCSNESDLCLVQNIANGYMIEHAGIMLPNGVKKIDSLDSILKMVLQKKIKI